MYKMYKHPESIGERTTVSEARRTFAELVNRVAYGNARITVARHGRDLVAIVPMSDVRRLQAMEPGPAGASTEPAPVASRRAPQHGGGGPRS